MNGVCETPLVTKQTILKEKLIDKDISLKNQLPFECLFCKERIPKIVAYFKHIQKHDMKQIHKCPICKKICIQDDHFREHLYNKHQESVENNNVCDSIEEYPISVPEFIVEEVQAEYLADDPNNNNKKTNNNISTETNPNKCSVCLRTFNSKKSLSKHFESKHRNKAKMDGFYQSLTKLSYNYYHQYQTIPVAAAVTTTTGPTQILTGYVIQQEPPPLIQFQTQSQPQQTEQTMATKTTQTQNPPQPGNVSVMQEQPKNGQTGYQFKCQFCGQLFSKTTKLSQHLRTHNGKPFKCDICDKSYTQSSALGLHKRRHHYNEQDVNFRKRIRRPKQEIDTNNQSQICFEQIYECQQCNKQFSKPNSLKQHYLVHTEIQPYKCDICAATFAQSSALALHKISHTNKSPYRCEFCNKEFAISDHHKRHLRVHTKEKPFKCDVCQKAFSQPNTLTQHYRIHSGEKPYECPICHKSFSVLNYLNNHIRTHSGQKDFECSVCHKQFSHKTSLNIHMKSHHYNNS